MSRDTRRVADASVRDAVDVASGGSLAGNADLRQAAGGAWEIHGDPTEAAFMVAERKLGLTDRRFERISEVPFTSERKMMSTIEVDHERADERVLITKGAANVLPERCTWVRRGMDTVELDGALREQILRTCPSSTPHSTPCHWTPASGWSA